MTETTLKARRVWEDNTKMDLKDIEGKNVDWVCVVEDKEMKGYYKDDTEDNTEDDTEDDTEHSVAIK